MKSFRIWMVATALVGVACGTPEALPPADPPPVETPEPLRIVSSTPAANATNVPLGSTATVTFSSPLPADSVNRKNISLIQFSDGCFSTVPTRLALSSDGLTVTISYAPFADRGYRLLFSGLVATDGKVLPDSQLQWEHGLHFSTTTAGGGANISSATRRLDGPDGRLKYYVSLNGSGTDGEWLTDDDAIALYIGYERGSDGRLLAQVIYDGAGTDAEWFTEDDQIRNLVRYEHASSGSVTAQFNVQGAGLDGVWRTADDEVGYVSANQLDAQGRCIGEREVDSAGDDGLWLTADDVLGEQSRAYLNDTYDVIYDLHSDDPGADGVMFTDDDIYYHRAYALDEQGARIVETSSSDPGPDLIWRNEDDVLGWLSRSERGSHTELLSFTRYLAGTDDVFGTQDDVPHSRIVFTYDGESGLVLGRIDYSGPGTNGVWGDADDRVSSYSATSGSPRQTVTYNNAGTDAQWFTADDVISSVGHWAF